MTNDHRKVCKDCGEELPLTEFHQNRTYKDKHLPWCRACVSVRKKEQHRKQGGNNFGDTMTRRCTSCGVSFEWVVRRGPLPTRCRECQAAYELERRREKYRHHDLKKNYGITIEQYDALVAQQAGRCAICAATRPGGRHKGNWYVDHDHATGAVRALLCCNCNVGVGMFQDRPDLLRAAADYLERF